MLQKSYAFVPNQFNYFTVMPFFFVVVVCLSAYKKRDKNVICHLYIIISHELKLFLTSLTKPYLNYLNLSSLT